MKRILCIICCAACLMVGVALAGGLSGLTSTPASALPDPALVLPGGATLYDARWKVDRGPTCSAYTYPMPEDWQAFLATYRQLLTANGYTLQETTFEGRQAWQIGSTSAVGWLVPEYSGSLLMLVSLSEPFQPVPTPQNGTPRPTRTPAPAPVPGTGANPGAAATKAPGHGHVEYVETKQDCFACTSGVCNLCHGSGIYRGYGVSVLCSPWCQTCDGLGWWITTTPVWVIN